MQQKSLNIKKIKVNVKAQHTQQRREQSFVLRRRWYKEQDNLINPDEVNEGKFNESEIQKIFNYLKEYQIEHNITDEQMQDLIENSSRGKFDIWLTISKKIPYRRVQAIYRLIHRNLAKYNRQGFWKKEEEEELVKYVNQYGRKWKLISKYINRTPDNLRNKYYSLGEQNHFFRNKNTWSIDEFVKTVDQIYQQTGVKLWSTHDYVKEFQQLNHDNWKQIAFTFNERKRTCESDSVLKVISSVIDKRKMNVQVKWTAIAREIKTKTKEDLRFMWSKLQKV